MAYTSRRRIRNLLGSRIAKYPEDSTLLKAVEMADLETIAFLLTVPYLSDKWKSDEYVAKALTHSREDVAILLIQDGKYIENVGTENKFALAALKGLCGQVLAYLSKEITTLSPEDSEKYYIISQRRAYDETQIDYVVVLDFDNEDEDTISGQIVKYIHDGIVTDGLYQKISSNGIYTIIINGFLSRAFGLLKLKAASRVRVSAAILAGLNNGNITDYNGLIPYIRLGYITLELLENMVKYHKSNMSIMAHLIKLVDKKDRKRLVKEALKYGNWHYTVLFSSKYITLLKVIVL